MIDNKQIMGLSYAPRWVNEPELALPALKAAGKAGFGTVIGFARHMSRTIASDALRKAVALTTGHCHDLGLRFVLDMDWAHWAGAYVEKRPDMAMWSVCRGEGLCLDGKFVIDLRYPWSGVEEFAELSAIYGVLANGERTLLSKDQVEWTKDSFNSLYPVKSLDDDRAYDYYRPGRGAYYTLRICGSAPRTLRKVIVYVSFMTYRFPDVSNQAYLDMQRELLLSYKDIPLDGVNWDEPGKGGMLSSYKAGAAFFATFEQTHGYDLRERLIALDEGCAQTDMTVRRDYYRALNEMNHRAQSEFNLLAVELFGKDIFRGSHHTFSGLAMDIRCGCSDYFLLGRTLSHAFTDTGWEQGPFSESIYNFALAEGLRKELGMPGAYCNDWSRTPRVKWYDYFSRVKMLYGLDWFAIFIGQWCERHSTFPDDAYWEDVARNAADLNAFGRFLEGRFEAVSETAVWHGWEGVAALPASMNFYIRLLQTFSYNLSQVALETGRFFDYVSSRAIENAAVVKGCAVINGRRYRRLLLPYAVGLSDAMWRMVKSFSDKGVELVFVGPPPRWNLDTGESLAGEFCRMVSVAPFTFEDYNACFLDRKPEPAIDAWEPPLVDFSYPLTPAKGATATFDLEGDLVSVESRRGRTVYLPGCDPRQWLARHLGESGVEGIHHNGDALKRMLVSKRADGKKILVLAAKMECELDESLKIENQALGVKGGGWAAIEMEGGRVIRTITDRNTTFSGDGYCLKRGQARRGKPETRKTK